MIIVLYSIIDSLSFIIVGFVGTPPGVTAPPFTDTNNVVTNLTCPNNEECTGTIGSSGCGSYGGGYAAVTCTKCRSPINNLCLSVTSCLSTSFFYLFIYSFI